MSELREILLFGDQTNDFDMGIRQLSRGKNNTLLTSLLERSHHALRLEIGKLPAAQRDLFPRFTSILDLLARYRKSGLNPALESALTSIHQVACFIGIYAERSQDYPLHTKTRISGLCTGLLAAAAISSSRSLSDLLSVAIEAVKISFRAGLRTMKVRDSVCPPGPSTIWSVVISGLQENAAATALENFAHSEGLPTFSQPYISAVNSSSVTISGPPVILDCMLQSSPFDTWRSMKIPIHSPYHAAHLYDESDVDDILSSSSKEILTDHTPQIPIISSSTGDIIKAPDYRSMLRIALREILLEPFRWDNVLKACTAFANHDSGSTCNLIPIATSGIQNLASALRQNGILKVNIRRFTEAENIGDVLSTGRPEQSKIAIIGLSGRFPNAESPDSFWDLLYKGLDVHRTIPKDRFDVETHYDPTGKKKNTSQVTQGCFIENPGLFDARFFNMSPKEATQTDPAQRLAIITAYEALEMAGFVPNRTPSSQRDRVGVFYGMTSDDWREVNSAQNIDTYFIPGGMRAFSPGRISYHFKFSGPSVTVDTACSSSLAAIHTACNALWKGDCDTALAGGTNILTSPDNFVGLDKGHFLSRTGNCKTFDNDADGYCRSDGVGTVVLKRLEDAEADKDPIQGVILGAFTNHSAEAVSITRPDIGAQAICFEKTLNAANVEPSEISYIEMHGTGTQAGDAVEMSSCLEVFAPNIRARKSPLYLGSVKANVGHAESASGVTSLIKVLLMMRENMIPPHSGIKSTINHNFPSDLNERNVHIASRPTPWNHERGEKRKVFLNNFSAAGGNTVLLLEDSPKASLRVEDSRQIHMVAVSARSIDSLRKNAQALIIAMHNRQDFSLGNLSYTTLARRMHHKYRLLVSGSSVSEISKNLEQASRREVIDPVLNPTRRVAFAFSGQGSQYVGMGRQLFESFSLFRSQIKQLDVISQRQGFGSILPVIEGSAHTGSTPELSPVTLQLATTCLQMALVKLWSSWGVNPSVVIGHSLGEYAALHAAGVLSANDTIYLTGKRAQLLVGECKVETHSMLAIKASVDTLHDYLEGRGCEIACINAPEETVVSGLNTCIDELSQNLSNHGFKFTKLRVPFAFHSSQVEPILQQFEAVARGVTFHKPSIAVISPLLGEVVTQTGVFGPNYLSRHCREPVNFLEGLRVAMEAHVVSESDLFVEIGPHSVCSGMTKSTFGPKFMAVPSLRQSEETLKVLVGTLSSLYLAGIDIQWTEYHRDFEASLEVLPLPAYNWDAKNHWIQYVNDWCLTKGNSPSLTGSQPMVPTLSTSSVHKVVEQYAEKSKATVVVESDLSRPVLNAVLQGHKVNGTPLCPSSLYADIALTIGDYLVSRYNPKATDVAMDVANMRITKPLIANQDLKSQLLRTSASVDWNTQIAVLKFDSVSLEGKHFSNHATCDVKYGNGNDWKAEWQRSAYMIRPCLQRLEEDVSQGRSHKLKRGMAYRVFSSMVEYGNSYKGFEDVVLDSAGLEGTARIKFQTSEDDGDFFFSPYWVDNLAQLSGFVMNGNDAVDHKTTAYLNQGWNSMRFADIGALSDSTTYQTYVKMQPYDKTTHIGDVYIFAEDTVVAVFGGVKFQGVPHRLLDSVLPPIGAANAITKQSAPQFEKLRHGPAKKSKSPTAMTRIPAPSRGMDVVDQAMGILAEETGVNISELSDETDLAGLGVDSLLSLTISGRFREDLNIGVGSTIFAECPNVKDLKQYFLKNCSPTPSTPESLSEESASEASDDESITSIDSEEDGPIDDVITSIRLMLAQELGVSVEQIADKTNLAELGMDSLMTLTVTGRIRDELNMEVATDLFAENKSMTAIANTLGITPNPAKVTPSRSDRDSLRVQSPLMSTATPAASSILLQGNPKTSAKTLWLFPDGAGSATSYAALSRISDDVTVYGLNCPYMKTPQDLTCSLDGITSAYLKDIRRRQPHGPYYLGGWSAGGVGAFDAAQQLITQGEEVSRLIFLDSPFPIGITKLPSRLYDFFNSVGVLGTGEQGPPDWLIGHFHALVEALSKYHAVPFAAGKAPKTHVIWATDGLCKFPDSPRPEPGAEADPPQMQWLLENRTDFGPNGWDSLLGGRKNLVIETLEGVNHFSMMQGENARSISQFIARAMA